jgi:hypothetical protein
LFEPFGALNAKRKKSEHACSATVDARIAAARTISRLHSLDGAGALQTGHKNAGGLDKAGL